MNTIPVRGNEFGTESLVDLTQSRMLSLLTRCQSGADDIADLVQASVADIIAKVRARGDDAIRELGRRFDNVSLEALEVPGARRREAVSRLDPALRRAMEHSIRNLEVVQRSYLPVDTEVTPEPGVVIARRAHPIDRVGIYAPGGSAVYPSSVLMGAVTARVAGVRELVLCSPPTENGVPSLSVLAAAELAGVDRVFAIGGAGAIAAMAYGTATVPRVDRIVGPGNAYVAAAKTQVAGTVGIDSPAGPSELLIIADATADPGVIALEVLAQAEHDPRAVVIVVGIGEGVVQRIVDCIVAMLPTQERREIIAESLRARGAFLWASGIGPAVEFSNEFAPEHLLLAVEGAPELSPVLKNAGTIFSGERSSVTFGDYLTGANHVLPTGGLARSYSGLSVLDFMRWTTYQVIDPVVAEDMAKDACIFATAEGLPAHAAAALRWVAAASAGS